MAFASCWWGIDGRGRSGGSGCSRGGTFALVFAMILPLCLPFPFPGPPLRFLCTPNGPACHCGSSRPLPPFKSICISLLSFTETHKPSHLITFLFYLTGPACHCGRSRPLPSPSPFVQVYPFLRILAFPHRSSQVFSFPRRPYFPCPTYGVRYLHPQDHHHYHHHRHQRQHH